MIDKNVEVPHWSGGEAICPHCHGTGLVPIWDMEKIVGEDFSRPTLLGYKYCDCKQGQFRRTQVFRESNG